MTLWVVRTGKHGEHEQRFVDTQRIYLTWDGFNRDLGKFESKGDIATAIKQVYPEMSDGTAINHSGQMWAFARRITPGDWVVVPSKQKAAIHVAEITGKYQFDAKADDPYFHSHEIKWIARDVPRTSFGQDLLYSFGGVMTIFSVSRNDAEARVRAMAKSSWKQVTTPPFDRDGTDDTQTQDVDLEVAARDQIARLIISKFKGHGLERLVEGVLRAQGYTTYHSPMGADKGIDLLAGSGPLGFGSPRICVQVKSGDGPVDTMTLSQLVGTMQNVHADQGLLVSWGGFKSSVYKEIPVQFFRVRLWDQQALIEQLLEHYDRLDPDLRAELPLKRIWTVSQAGEAG